MTAEEEKAIRAWLEQIEETDPGIIAEVIEKCRRDAEARAYFLWRYEESPKQAMRAHLAQCGACIHFYRTGHPHLGHCAKGEPEAIAGLWDSGRRWCKQFSPGQKTMAKPAP